MPDLGTGYRPDDPAQRVTDTLAGLVLPPTLSVTPGQVTTDNRAKFNPPRRNQRRSNFCVRFAVCRALEHLEVRRGGKRVPFSPLFHSWNDAMQGDQGLNVGTQIYLSANAASIVGVCSEDRVPWEIAPDDYLTRMKARPNAEAFREAERHQVLPGSGSLRIPNGDWAGMKATLERGIGFVFGMPLRTSAFKVMNPAKGGIIDNTSGMIEGYHAMYALDAKVVNGKQYVSIDGSWAEQDELLVEVGRFGTDEFTDNRAFLDMEEIKP